MGASGGKKQANRLTGRQERMLAARLNGYAAGFGEAPIPTFPQRGKEKNCGERITPR